MKLIVGLGNPGKQYQKTRHNVGFAVLDQLHNLLASEKISSWDLSKKFNAEISGCTIKGNKIILLKPMTFMNESGIAVSLVAHFYKIPARDIIVVHDDKDIPLGEIKVQTNRGAAGHNGVTSLMQHLGTEAFTRVREGIRPANEKKMVDVSKFVLDKFGLFEKKIVTDIIQRAAAMTLELLRT